MSTSEQFKLPKSKTNLSEDREKDTDKECTSYEQSDVDNITEGIVAVTLLDGICMCACCGKEGNSDDMNTCNKCMVTKYCNASCKKKHKSKHKHDCAEHIRRALEHKKACEEQAAKLHDEALFKQPPLDEECPICLLPLPLGGGSYQACCGKRICCGCVHAAVKMKDGELKSDGKGNYLMVNTDKAPNCPFCRTAPPSSMKEQNERFKERMKLNDAMAFYNTACLYYHGDGGLPKSLKKSVELHLRAGELGCSASNYAVGLAYEKGRGVRRDMKKAVYYYELAAMKGHPDARHNLGCYEDRVPNMKRALKHYTIASGCGFADSVKQVKEMYRCGYATKDDYMKALQAYQSYTAEVKSIQRDEAAAFDKRFRYL